MNATTQQTTLGHLRSKEPEAMSDISIGFNSLQAFELTQRAAKALTRSTLVPKSYQTQHIKYDKYGKVKAVSYTHLTLPTIYPV